MKKIWLFVLILFSITLVSSLDALSPSQGTDVDITIDGDFPLITILNPQPTTYSNFTPLLVDFTVDDLTLDKIWYTLDNGTTNITITIPFNLELAEDNYTIIIYANDSFSRTNSSQVNFNINNSIPFCGNSICDGGESCSSCSSDCGTCPAPPSGGGGGSSGSDRTCQSTWYCDEWSNNNQNCGFRECLDINKCYINLGKPEENIMCPSQGTANNKDYCGNNICGTNEDFSTCENDCPLKETENNNIWFITITIGIIIIIFILIIMLFLLKRRKKKIKKKKVRKTKRKISLQT